MKTAYLIPIALLAVPAGAAEQHLNKDRQDACGSILCLAGGGATPECSSYLKKFTDIDPKGRRSFLGKCPTGGVSRDALGELAAYGQNCASR